jgi:hypothetical protein
MGEKQLNRLKDYDYSKSGYYFITIYAQAIYTNACVVVKLN